MEESRQKLLKDVLSFFPDKEEARRRLAHASLETLKRVLLIESHRQDNEILEQTFDY